MTIHETILAIESSCDDTAIAILDKNNTVLSNIICSQNQAHNPYGGIVPEIASRQHIGKISLALKQALVEAKISSEQISAVAATYAPGLIGSLLVGFTFAKGFAQASKVPFIAIHHLEGHIMAGSIEDDFPKKPFLALIVSGGHSCIYLVKENFIFETVATTRDDAAGEAFDKVAKMLGLGYPGGVVIDRLASKGDEKRFNFPVAFKGKGILEYSFSGLKTAVRYKIDELRAQGEAIEGQIVNDICASLRRAIVDALLNKAILACQKYNITNLVLGGGVAANSLLRSEALLRGAKKDIKVFLPSIGLCTDNALMIALAAKARLQEGLTSSLSLDVKSSADISDPFLQDIYLKSPQ